MAALGRKGSAISETQCRLCVVTNHPLYTIAIFAGRLQGLDIVVGSEAKVKSPQRQQRGDSEEDGDSEEEKHPYAKVPRNQPQRVAAAAEGMRTLPRSKVSGGCGSPRLLAMGG